MTLGYRHQKVQRLRRLLARRTQRDAEQVFVVEGYKLLDEALSSGAQIESVFVSSAVDETRLAAVRERNIRVHYLENGVLERVADATTPQPVLAVVGFVDQKIADLTPDRPVVVLVDVRDPGNAGTVMRSAEAAGMGGVIFCDGSVDVYNPKTVRSSMGAVFHLPVVVGSTSTTVIDELGSAGFQSVGTAGDAAVVYDALDLTQPIAFFFGNEANGLAPDLVSQLQQTIAIPIVGRTESLNVAMAASIICFESARQRRQNEVSSRGH